MTQLSEEQKRQIANELEKRGATLPCPRCGNRSFILLDGYFIQPVSTEIGALVLGGPTVPTVVTGCTNCGYLSQHALGVLGLLPSREEGKSNE